MERIGVAPGTEIGGYRVLAPLGAGGMGAVYKAEDGGGAPVALKLLHPHLGADPHARERLRREVLHLQRVRHTGVAQVLDAEIESTEAFVVTELVEGADLAAHVREHGPMPLPEVVELADQLRAALTEVHAAGVLHRDLTPGNVLVSPRGAVLIDFGIAQAAEDPRVTSTGMVVGTPGYLSPELLEGGEPSEAADWWGWAAVLAFAATGRPPFGQRPVHAVLARARAGEPDLVGLPTRFAATLRRALAVDPRHRLEPTRVVEELTESADDELPEDATQVLAQTPADVEPTSVVHTAATAVMPDLPPPHEQATAVMPVDPRDAQSTQVQPVLPEEWDDEPDEHLPYGVPVQDHQWDEAAVAPEPGARPARPRTGSVLALAALLA
ncbi:serine/threonine protein kinase, partial [Cellulomonas bogoriensis 69B4 = DSM 16987]